ncbi:MAG: exodeoxyribonuclease III, partial [Betaproteobacteria bacterium]|nr:exodeoxyribonuclease III [Betaproteobacteria bacterium]
KLATWNVNSLTVRLPQVLDWLSAQNEHGGMDVLALQETKTTDDKFPKTEIEAAGYHLAFFGQKTYNGVALIAKHPITEVVHNIPGFADEMARVITATVNGVRVVGAYFPNGQAPDSDKFVYKMAWLNALQAFIKDELSRHDKLVLMGDFNITWDDLDVWDPVALAGTIHCTDEERAHFKALLDLGLTDAFRLFEQAPKSYSWWDYREFAFKRNRGLRIDHILVSSALVKSVTACVIDKAPRKNERPSDHTPVIVTL